jgi:HD superfamily phosphodiesterase
VDIIVAAALIAVGIVGAAAVYARVTRGAWPTAHLGVPTSGVTVVETTVSAGKSLTAAPGSTNGGGRAHSDELVRREQALREREAEISERSSLLDQQQEQLVLELERISGVSATRAKQLLIETIEDDARQEAARRLRQIEDDTKREADRRVRNILAVVMQRLAAAHAAETTVSVVQLSSDDMKGRIIGREGRNIRVLETLTGVDFIIDDTPGAVVLSGFDGVRREIARLTLERLLQDGRIHPARIEEVYFQVKSELDTHILQAGEEGAFEGGDLARKYGETEAVVHAMEAHHNEVEPQTVEAVVVQAADALSGARPGARGESLELYVKRLRDLEEIATRHKGVDKVYAMQAGREIRVIVAPDAIDDAGATLLSFEIARSIEKQLEYPGQIKVTVIRESRAVDYAR